ncbi:MAG: biotin--[Eubacterium sp.]|nr:biotin--[acetyl-CoA-carboxylase] ligase [Eubacterium sp.]
MLKDELLKTLEEESPEPISGQRLAERFQVSRNAVWKAVNRLKEEGHEIISDPARGYALSAASDVLYEEGIRSYIRTEPGIRINVFRETDSTNNEAKRRLGTGDQENILLVADHQTTGRGRMGHSFYSPAGTGIYMTLSMELGKPLLKPERITLAAAVAVVRVFSPYLEEKPQLKWVNDIFYKGKKVAGILSEGISDLETGMIHHVIVGIGMNVLPAKFPAELADIAGSFGLTKPHRNELAGRITEELLTLYADLSDDAFLSEYLACSMHPDRVMKELGITES